MLSEMIKSNGAGERMAIQKKRQHNISIRLHTKKVKKYQDVLKGVYQLGGKCQATKTIIPRKYGHGVAYSLFNQSSRATWANDFESLLNHKVSVPDNEYSKAVIVFKVISRQKNTRFMSISFGYGDSLLDSSMYDTDFGKSIAAQKIPDSSVYSAETIEISDAIIQMEKQYAGSKMSGMRHLVSSAAEFPKSITGTWENGAVETRMSGRGELLKASRKMNLEELSVDLGVYLDIYLNPSILAEWATRLTQISSGRLKEKLDESLMKKMIQGEIEYGISWPNYLDLASISLELTKGIPEELSPAEKLSRYIQQKTTGNSNLSVDQLKRKIKSSKVSAVGMDGVSLSEPLYKCISANLVYDKQSYLLFTGVWYKISKNFYQDLQDKVNSVPEYKPDLPPLGLKTNKSGNVGNEDEGDYNKRLANSINDGEVFDKVDFNNKKGSSFSGLEEPADVITKSKHFFFVKKGTSSAALSHLFLQGLVSAKLFAQSGDSEFRDFINDTFKRKYHAKDTVFPPNVVNADVTLIFVIIRDKHQLPFFSMISFTEVVRNLREMGYKVKIAWVATP